MGHFTSFFRRVLIAPLLTVATATAGLCLVSSVPAGAASAQSNSQLSISSIQPSAGENGVQWSTTIAIRFSLPLAKNPVLPSISPPVAGRWTKPSPDSLVFQPTGFFRPGTTYSVTVPGGTSGLVGSGGQHFVHTVVSSFGTVGATLLRLQQLLAELNYLPVAFTPKGVHTANALAKEPNNAALVSYSPEVGGFTPRYKNTPPQLMSLFKPGVWTVLDRSAIIIFESHHGLNIDGNPSGAVWAAVAAAVAARQVLNSGYNYVLVSETLPERLSVWHNGSIVVSSLANTGVSGANTPLGTWPVWLRFVSTTMKGTNPNGTKYDDPGVPNVAYFYGSDAVHGFVRGSYGSPQSNGCVELPPAVSQTVYGYDPIGTLVTVTTGKLPT